MAPAWISPTSDDARRPPRSPSLRLHAAARPAEILPFGDPERLRAPDESQQYHCELAAANAYIQQLEEKQWELLQAISHLVELAATDGLTGLHNRRSFNESLETAYSLVHRHGLPLSMIMLDVDHFKQYNDTYGHRAGDDVLRVVAETLRESVREHDVASRYGGEEFAVLLIATDADGALQFAERLRTAIESHPWPLRKVTISQGVATLDVATMEPYDLVESADRALYQSKIKGRNCVTHYQALAGGVVGTHPGSSIRRE